MTASGGQNRGRYAYVRYPWSARIGTGSPHPARHYAALIGQTLRYGMPSRRRFGAAWALAGRRGIPEGLLAMGLRRFPRVGDRRLDALLAALSARWSELAGASDRLPSDPGPLSALALERSAGLTVFAFGSGPAPLVVAKTQTGTAGRLDAELAALHAAAPAGVAPRVLGEVDGAHVQEAVAGAPLAVPALTPALAERLEWTVEHDSLVAGLTRLAAATAAGTPPATLAGRVGRALEYPGLPQHSRSALATAWRDVRPLERSVLRHRDASPQNTLFSDRRLTGIVDWELAEVHGPPGFDVWNACLSYVEHGLGLVRFSEDIAVEALERSWERSPFWSRGRAAARQAAAEAGVPDSRLDALEVVFFGARIGDRLDVPEIQRGTGAAASARMCEVVTG